MPIFFYSYGKQGLGEDGDQEIWDLLAEAEDEIKSSLSAELASKVISSQMTVQRMTEWMRAEETSREAIELEESYRIIKIEIPVA